MCKSANEPGGPYRCTAHMKSALLESSARYAKALRQLSTAKNAYEEALAHKENTAQLVEQMEDLDEAQIVYLEDVQNLCERAKNEQSAAYAEVERRSALLRTAQLNYDATVGGMQDLSLASFELEQKISELEKLESPDQGQLESLYADRERLERRMKAASRNMSRRNAEIPGVSHFPIVAQDSEDESSFVPEGGESEDSAFYEISQANDLLDTEEINASIDKIIEDEELHGVARIHEGYTDPVTGEMYSEQEIRVASLKRREELRLLQRGAGVDPNKMMLRQALRTALYRAMYFSRSTRRIARLIGIGQFNGFMDKLEGRIAERNYQKGQKAAEAWRAKRESIADSEADRFRQELAQTDSKIAEIQSELAQGVSEERRQKLHSRLAGAQQDRLASQAGLNGVDYSRAQWRTEDTERARESEDERRAAAEYIRQQRSSGAPSPSEIAREDDPFNDINYLMTD